MSTYYVLIQEWNRPWPGTGIGRTVYVKEGEFFKSQGGLTDEWGKSWIPVQAESIEHARSVGMEMELEDVRV